MTTRIRRSAVAWQQPQSPYRLHVQNQRDISNSLLNIQYRTVDSGCTHASSLLISPASYGYGGDVRYDLIGVAPQFKSVFTTSFPHEITVVVNLVWLYSPHLEPRRRHRFPDSLTHQTA